LKKELGDPPGRLSIMEEPIDVAKETEPPKEISDESPKQSKDLPKSLSLSEKIKSKYTDEIDYHLKSKISEVEEKLKRQTVVIDSLNLELEKHRATSMSIPPSSTEEKILHRFIKKDI